jgi:hypothetical protein
MPIVTPNLDDRTYQDLVQEGIALIPRYSREWTNHNASDPGITLLEVFAYVTEIFLYRINLVSDAHRTKFLKLLTGGGPPEQNHAALEAALRQASLEMRRPTRAVTSADFEAIAYQAVQDEPPDQQVRRVKCLARRNLGERSSAEEAHRDQPGHFTVVFVCTDPRQAQVVQQKILQYLEPRRLLTSRVHVREAGYLDLGIRIRAVLSPGASQAAATRSLSLALNRFFDPLTGGLGGSGWPFGRSVYTSDISRMERPEGVQSLRLEAFEVSDSARLQKNEAGEVVEVRLRPDELVRIRISEVAFDRPGGVPFGGLYK